MMAKRRTPKFSRLTEEECSHVWANTGQKVQGISTVYCILCGKTQTPEK